NAPWHEYSPRPTRAMGVLEKRGWRLKRYRIHAPGRDFDGQDWEKGIDSIAGLLPQPPRAAGRAGAGFVIEHPGHGVDYLVLCWWDSENELFNRVLTCDPSTPGAWMLATSGTTACVWDLAVVNFERDSWVETMLCAKPDADAYLARVFSADDYRTSGVASRPVPPDRVNGVGQVAIRCIDVARATAFYRDVLGLKFLFAAGPGLSFLDAGGVRLMLSRPEQAEFDHPASILYYRVADIAAAVARIEAAGTKVTEAAHCVAKLPDHDLWLAGFKDSEGNHVCLMSEVRGAR
ncbi:MAG TPA: VOC family protein, partial [Opitutaceae bacterium]